MTDRDKELCIRCSVPHIRLFHPRGGPCRYGRCRCPGFQGKESPDAVLDRPAVNRPAPLRPASEGTGVALESEPADPQPPPVAQTRAFMEGVDTIMRGLREHRARGARWE